MKIISAEVQNLRGYQRATLDLRRDLTILVGPNNAGKTSLLMLLDWFINTAGEDVLTGKAPLSLDESALLVPARETRNQARRLLLRVRVPDGRQRGRFRCQGDIAILRLGLRQSPTPHLRLNLGPAQQGEGSASDPEALELFRLLRSSVWLQVVPAARDARSERFVATLGAALKARLTERAVHETQGGAPGEYRTIKRGIATLAEITEQLADPLWTEMQSDLLPGLSRQGRFRLHLTPRDLVEWLAQRLRFEVVTGPHDPNSVAPTHVGSGLQSLLDLAVLRASVKPSTGQQEILAIEEPEAFLHPSAQRALARRLFDNNAVHLILSTHSPILVEEAPAASVVLVREHRIYEPSWVEPDRDEINSALLTGSGAELAFATSALLVEGDRMFFDGLRRRVAELDRSGWTSQAFVAAVGSNSSFAPWIRLLRLYGDDSTRPIEWLVVADGDSTGAIRAAFRDAGVSLSASTRVAMRRLEAANRDNNRAAAAVAARSLNSAAQRSTERFRLMSVDLEWGAVGACSDATATMLAGVLGSPSSTSEELGSWLGSKCLDLSRSSSGRKAPWMRSKLAAHTPWAEVSDEVKGILRAWLEPCAPSRAALRRLLAAADQSL